MKISITYSLCAIILRAFNLVLPQFSSNIKKLILNIGNFCIVVVLIKMPHTRSKSKAGPSETTAWTQKRRHSSSDSEHPSKQARQERKFEAQFSNMYDSSCSKVFALKVITKEQKHFRGELIQKICIWTFLKIKKYTLMLKRNTSCDYQHEFFMNN